MSILLVTAASHFKFLKNVKLNKKAILSTYLLTKFKKIKKN